MNGRKLQLENGCKALRRSVSPDTKNENYYDLGADVSYKERTHLSKKKGLGHKDNAYIPMNGLTYTVIKIWIRYKGWTEWTYMKVRKWA